MRKMMAKAAVRISFVAISSFTLLAANPSTVAASTTFGDKDGPGAQQQIPAQSGSGAPIQHIPGNAQTGDASKSGGSKSGGSKTKKDTKDTTGDGTGAGSNGATGPNTAGADKTGDTTGDGTGAATNGASGDTAGDDDDDAVPGGTGNNAGGTGQTGGIVTVDTQTVGSVTVRTETTTLTNGARIIRVFNNNVLLSTTTVGAGQAIPAGVLGSQQAPGAVAGAQQAPGAVAGSQQSPADIAMLPATTPASAPAPIGLLGASMIAAGAWLLRRGRKA